MIDIRKLKELVRLMVANELTELDLRDSEEQVTLRRGMGGGAAGHMAMPPTAAAPIAPAMAAAPATAGATPATGDAAAASSPAVDDDSLHRIESPMVGTFYAAADPDSEPFVAVGASVGPDTVVCIVEAMKIFNEIRAECSGTITRVLVKNGDSIEFGQPLFEVKPA